MKIMVLGDVHGDWSALNKLLNRKLPDIVLQCGDFGYWPNFVPEASYFDIKLLRRVRRRACNIGPRVNKGCKLMWCDGNHEDHWSLKQRKTDELWPGVVYMPRGTVTKLPDGRKVMFVGGATSVDKDTRKLGVDWFPEEVISMSDYASFPPSHKVDIVISHTCPTQFAMRDGYHDNDCSRTALSSVLEYYRPDRWYFGHWHSNKRGRYVDFGVDCEWQALNMNGRTGWWKWLPDR